MDTTSDLRSPNALSGKLTLEAARRLGRDALLTRLEAAEVLRISYRTLSDKFAGERAEAHQDRPASRCLPGRRRPRFRRRRRLIIGFAR